jgi:putative ABC transport system permease protein
MAAPFQRHWSRAAKGLIVRWHHRLYVTLRSWFKSSTLDRELDEELQFHFERQLEANLAAGMAPEQARRSAALAIGHLDSIRETSRDRRAGALIRQFARDLLLGARLLVKAPMFSLTAITIVVLGIGSVTAIFSVVYGILLKPLPFPEPDRLVQIWTRSPRYARDAVSAADRRDWQAENTVFTGIALYNPLANFNLTDGAGEPERLLAGRISANTHAVLGVPPALGRAFTEDEDEVGNERVVILGDSLWRRRFGADPAIVGRTIRLSGVPHEVVGVMGPDFPYPERPYDLWVPLTVNPREMTREIPPFGLRSVARLRPGVTLEAAQQQMEQIAARIAEQHPMNKDVGIVLVPLRSNLVDDVRVALYVWLAAVSCLLLVAALNLAGLLSARAAARSREIGVRLALGASRARVASQTIAEIAPILAVGGLLGVAAAAIAVRWFVAAAPPTLPRAHGISVDGLVLTVSVIVLMLTGFTAALLPAMQTWSVDLMSATRDGGRGSTTSPRQSRMRRGLVVAQIALSVPLLAGAVLLTRSFSSVVSIDPGFNPDRLVSLHLAIPRSKYRSDGRIAELETLLLERVATAPGVRAAAITNRLPLSGYTSNLTLEFDDRDPRPSLYGVRVVTPGYFQTLGIPLLEGRSFNSSDTANAPLVAIVDAQVARQRWPGQSAIGKRMRQPARGVTPSTPWMEIVGVVGHVKHEGLDVQSLGQIYWDYRQRTQDRMVVVARTDAEPARTITAIADRIREIDPEQPIYDARTLDDVMARSVGQRRLAMVLVAAVAIMALVLSAVGVYGVIAFGVATQQREFGVRLALGATRSAVTRAVVSRGAALAATGAAIGLGVAAIVTRGIQSLLYGVSNNDIASYTIAAAAMIGVALVASYLPARRAALVDPADTLRAE